MTNDLIEIFSKDTADMKKIVILINDTTYAYNLRGAIIEQLIQEGDQVVVVGKLLEHQEKLKGLGAKLIGVDTGRHGKIHLQICTFFCNTAKSLKKKNRI